MRKLLIALLFVTACTSEEERARKAMADEARKAGFTLEQLERRITEADDFRKTRKAFVPTEPVAAGKPDPIVKNVELATLVDAGWVRKVNASERRTTSAFGRRNVTTWSIPGYRYELMSKATKFPWLERKSGLTIALADRKFGRVTSLSTSGEMIQVKFEWAWAPTEVGTQCCATLLGLGEKPKTYNGTATFKARSGETLPQEIKFDEDAAGGR
ncbi:MAG TPA: hypothetical protein VF618_19330 [Thermoanaerobaculia bacterium]